MMRTFTNISKSVLLVMCVAHAATYAVGADAPTPRTVSEIGQIQHDLDNMLPDHFDLSVAVTDAKQYPAKVFETLAGAHSQEEFGRLMQALPAPQSQPATNLAVSLRGKTTDGNMISRDVVTDQQGVAKFVLIPRGEYRVYAEKLANTQLGAERVAYTESRVTLDRSQQVRLHLSTDFVTVNGRITDVAGNPIQGAKVIAVEVMGPNAGEMAPPTYTSISGADGSYQLRAIGPVNFMRILPYLAKGKGQVGSVTIHVESPGLVQADGKVMHVPLISEDQLALARRFMDAHNQMARRAGIPEVREKENLHFPTSKGNEITDIDIVLQPVGSRTP